METVQSDLQVTSAVSRTDALEPYIWALLGLGVLRGLLSFSSRFALFRMAYELEFDLRNILFEHLSRLPFSFFDRMQSGQVISRANSDIRTGSFTCSRRRA